MGRCLYNGFSAHPARLGSEVNAFSRALCDVSSCVTHQGGTALHSSGAGVLWNGVSLYSDDLSTFGLGLAPVTGGLLVLLDARLVDDCSCACNNQICLDRILKRSFLQCCCRAYTRQTNLTKLVSAM